MFTDITSSTIHPNTPKPVTGNGFSVCMNITNDSTTDVQLTLENDVLDQALLRPGALGPREGLSGCPLWTRRGQGGMGRARPITALPVRAQCWPRARPLWFGP